VNLLLLGCGKFASPFWVTFNQVRALGGSVRKGERGTPVVKWGKFEPRGEHPANETADGKGKPKFFLRQYVAFNAVQTEGIAFPELPNLAAMPDAKRIEVAEQIVAGMPQSPVIMEGQRNEAIYQQTTDTVFMPPFGSFESAERYYLTLFHELSHSTGHETRLSRKSLLDHDGFGGKTYSLEELVAEMGAAFLGMEADIVQDEHEHSAAYIKSWLNVLGNPEQKRWLVLAANHAARAADFVLGVNQEAAPETTAAAA
jgi:antirestriction protein ArdC